MGCKQSKTRFSEPAAEGGHVMHPATDGPADGSAAADAAHRPSGRHHVDPAAHPASGNASHHNNNNNNNHRPNGSTSPGGAHRRTPGPSSSKYKGPGPTLDGDVQPCFKDGLLYRIVLPTAWHFYNDTQEYEMHVSFTFGAGSQISAVPPATLQQTAGEAGGLMVSVIVYPGETTPFIEGKFNGYKSNIAARPLSSEYRNKVNAAANHKVQLELEVIQKLSRGSKDIQRILEACVRQGVPFVDVAFPPLQASLYRSGVDTRAIAETAWKRPTDYLPASEHNRISLFCNGVDPNDIDQGQLGDCWLLCSIAALAEFGSKVEDMFAHPVSDAAARQEQRVGAYRVTLNKHGWWHIILVDDYLPVVGAKPCFAKCIEDPAELWVSLLEKAYAKLHGSYAAITGGDALQALQDLTGYPVYRLDEEFTAAASDVHASDALFQKLVKYDEMKFLVNLNTPGHDTSSYMAGGNGKNSSAMEERYKKAGLALGHAYTALQSRFFPQHNLRLMQIRNPWGNGVEWTGRWGDHDASWQQYPDVARAIGFHAADDGTFWMAWEDVLRFFDGGGVCFTRFDWFDYRARGRFENGFPTLVFEVTVSQPVEAYCVISQKDKRGLPPNDPEAKYSAMMLSVSRAESHHAANQKIHLNTSANTEEPSEEFTFNYARDLGLKYRFIPEESPYYVIPRIYDAGGNRDYVLGMITDHPATDDAVLDISFVSLPKTCRVFHNYPSFSVENTVPLKTDYQQNLEVGAPETKRGTRIE
ncbi:calpain-like cysteine peptidase, putative [Bodo saltans]|uniref:Calpain-like cysteine peptidase, putative n=1 Tax=Bodo saltans TaxID=75058 RepID=A0A0S4KGT2_BODSA|nr:calpain-like cysteine peptidase, putative [Bodo saltans]|eukprot:CUI14920.1 calpain-like cysteine peptidase, putative [Bodo saltans]